MSANAAERPRPRVHAHVHSESKHGLITEAADKVNAEVLV